MAIISIGDYLDKIVSKLNSITSISDLLPGGIFSGKIDDNNLPTEEYMYISLTSDIIESKSNRGSLLKVARLSFAIVGKTDSVEQELYEISNTISNEIVDEGCVKFHDWDGFSVKGVDEGQPTQVSTQIINRPHIFKDYFFTYYGIS